MRLTSTSHGRFLTIGTLLLGLNGAAPAADPTPEELVAAYEKSCKAWEHAAYRVEEKITYIAGPKYPAGHVIDEADFQVWQDGERRKFLHSHTSHLQHNGMMIERESAAEQLFPGKGYVFVRVKPAPPENLLNRIAIIAANLGEIPDHRKGVLYPEPIAR